MPTQHEVNTARDAYREYMRRADPHYPVLHMLHEAAVRKALEAAENARSAPTALCKGALSLGSGCGQCERCAREARDLMRSNAIRLPSASRLTDEQNSALAVFAAAFGWDSRPLDEVGLIAWAAFHYYMMRLP